MSGGPCMVGSKVAIYGDMADRRNEPQSYGSQKEWLTGKTGQDVNRLKGNRNSQRGGDFYANGSDQTQVFESDPPGKAVEDDGQQSQKVSSESSGAKRDGYFKKRDYY